MKLNLLQSSIFFFLQLALAVPIPFTDNGHKSLFADRGATGLSRASPSNDLGMPSPAAKRDKTPEICPPGSYKRVLKRCIGSRDVEGRIID